MRKSQSQLSLGHIAGLVLGLSYAVPAMSETGFSALGNQCADIALKRIDGKKTDKVGTQIPEKRLYVLNLKTTKHMKLEIDRKLIEGASMVYE